jgi:hypothetical protein
MLSKHHYLEIRKAIYELKSPKLTLQIIDRYL